ncbi:hypothetical protein Bbelb_352240 [Branchiostoma belcheri]|nr:hypothetical protein Bbelb_352240 [Branchiostoma belcheri]
MEQVVCPPILRRQLFMTAAVDNIDHNPSSTTAKDSFHENAHTAAIVKHSMDVVRAAVDHLNPGQTPVMTSDQPLFAIAKAIHWKWPKKYGEDKMGLQRQERQSPSFELLISRGLGGHTRSQQQLFTYFSGKPITSAYRLVERQFSNLLISLPVSWEYHTSPKADWRRLECFS